MSRTYRLNILVFSLAMRVVALVVAYCVASFDCRAEFLLLGPRPYLSKADSPFPVDGSNSDFLLEDFEDGELNTPGIRQRNLYPIPGELGLAIVQAPGSRTDSVDADDGRIDGFGRDGHSLASGVYFTAPMIPPSHQFPIEFEFDEREFGFLPNAFGFVWTDGPPSSGLSIRIVTATGRAFSTEALVGLGDGARDGQTFEDFFVGVIGTEAIRTVTISGGIRGELPSSPAIEIDHVQYGQIVAEPASALLALLATGALLCWRIGRQRRFQVKEHVKQGGIMP